MRTSVAHYCFSFFCLPLGPSACYSFRVIRSPRSRQDPFQSCSGGSQLASWLKSPFALFPVRNSTRIHESSLLLHHHHVSPWIRLSPSLSLSHLFGSGWYHIHSGIGGFAEPWTSAYMLHIQVTSPGIGPQRTFYFEALRILLQRAICRRLDSSCLISDPVVSDPAGFEREPDVI